MAVTILIVDDEKPIRLLFASFLREQGYGVMTATSAQEAREILAQHRVHLVITDLNMPEEHGMVLIRYLKDYYPKIGIIVATVLDNPHEAQEVLDMGVYGYIVKPFNKNLVTITVANAIRRMQLEAEKEFSARELESRYLTILDNIHVGMMLVDNEYRMSDLNREMRSWFDGVTVGDHVNAMDDFVIAIDHGQSLENLIGKVVTVKVPEYGRGRFITTKGERVLEMSLFPVFSSEADCEATVIMLVDITDSLTMERELRQAQKLEAIGQLAAGIAHEINTPIQYIGDNLRFVNDAFADLNALLSGYESLCRSVSEYETLAGQLKEVERLRDAADIEFLADEIPATLAQSLEGVSRVGSIVRSMKEFSHPGSEEKVPTDINSCLDSTLTVSRNEWKYVAEVETEFSPDLPRVYCIPGDLNQVFLNLVVNAAHAIGNRVENGHYLKGLITVSTILHDGDVEVKITDNGGGIPPELQERVFEPFFTTKEIGKGTGQGLSIAYSIIVDKHSGSITLESIENQGTIFRIRLPIGQ